MLFGAHLLGKEDVRLYDGSWSEWGADPATPKATGAGMSKKRKPATRLVEAGRRKEWTQGIVNPPVWRASTILFDSVAEMEAANPPGDGVLHYGRNGTPTTWALCEALTELEPGRGDDAALSVRRRPRWRRRCCRCWRPATSC